MPLVQQAGWPRRGFARLGDEGTRGSFVDMPHYLPPFALQPRPSKQRLRRSSHNHERTNSADRHLPELEFRV